MGLFDGSFSNPSSMLPLLGLIQGLGQASQPSRLPVPMGAVLGQAASGLQQGLGQQQQMQTNQLSQTDARFGLQQKLGPVNFMRSLQGQKPLTYDDVVAGNYGSPMGTPITAAPPTQPAAVPQMGAQSPAPMQPAPQAGAAPFAIPDDLKANPIFQAAVQAGDATTAMSMLTKHQVQLTPDELKANNLPPDTLAFKAPDGTIDIKHQGTIKTPEQIQSEVAEAQAKGIKSQAQIDQELAIKRLEDGIQPASVERSITLPLLQKMERGEQLTPGEQAVLAATKPQASQAPITGQAPGTLGSQTIDATPPGYSRDIVPNTGGLTQSAIDQGAIEFATTGKMPGGMGLGSSGAGGQRKNAIQNRASELNAGGNITANAANLKALTSSLTQQTNYANSTERSVANAENGFNQLTSSFMGKVNNSQLPIVNAITNAGKYQLSPGDISAYRAGLTEVANEYSNVFSRGGMVTDAVRTQAKEIADGNLSIADLKKVVDELQAQGNIVIDGSRAQVSKIQGQLNNILQGGAAPQQAPPAPPASNPSQKAMLPRPKTPAEASALKPGTHFLDPNGTERVR